MKKLRFIILLIVLINIGSCIRNYVPNIRDYEDGIVVQGLITDQPEIYTIKISKSQPLWKREFPKPLKDCIVSISDDLGQTYGLKETELFGIYVTDPACFRGVVGRVYTLHIRTTTEPVNLNYESLPVKMIPVPPIDSLYFEKKAFLRSDLPVEGCNIYLNTHDPSNYCRFYRWQYSETWEFHLPFDFPNRICWISNNPEEILIKNASFLDEASVIRHSLLSIKDPVDRLSIKYSILVNQFSLNEDEYLYWERLKNTINQTGSLYDIVPAFIPNNVYCVEEPDKKVLGYFSVSAMSSRRLFIKDKFAGIDARYSRCLADTFYTNRPDTISFFGTIMKEIPTNPRGFIYTNDITCVDCTSRGTNIRPAFWGESK